MKEKIRKELIRDLFDRFEDKGITKELAAKIVDKTLNDDDYKAKEKRLEADIEKNELFGKSVKEICVFLKSLEMKYGEGTLEEGWSGYEENYLVYVYNGLESEDDIYIRLHKIVKDKARIEIEEIEAEKKRLERIKKLEDELNKLKRNKK